jgi:AraC-like DNA-binding protein
MQKDITEKVSDVVAYRKIDAVTDFIDNLRVQITGEDIFNKPELKKLDDFLVSSFLLINIQEGELTVRDGRNSYVCRQGDMFLFLPFRDYSAESTGEANLKFLYLNFEVTPYAQRNTMERVMSQGEGSYLGTAAFRNMSGTMNAICRSKARELPGHRALLRLYVSSLFVYILRARTESQEDFKMFLPDNDSISLVNKAIDYTEAHLDSRIDVFAAAKSIGVSKSTLYNAFIATVSVSPAKFLTRYKMKLATGLLQRHMGIKEISSSLGYSSICHFSNTFKAVFGLSPSNWKRYRTTPQ